MEKLHGRRVIGKFINQVDAVLEEDHSHPGKSFVEEVFCCTIRFVVVSTWQIQLLLPCYNLGPNTFDKILLRKRVIGGKRPIGETKVKWELKQCSWNKVDLTFLMQ